jgi:hypothetical protein
VVDIRPNPSAHQEFYMSKIVGGCLCGAIRYTSSAPALMQAVCHCKHCQRQTGTAFSVLVGLAKGSLVLTGDKPATFHDKGTSGMAVERRFCAKCGSPLYSDAAAMPTMEWLKAGTLDDTSWLQPQANVWCDSAQPWLPKSDKMAYFPQNPPSA